MASLNKLFLDPCKSNWNSSIAMGGGRFSLQKQQLAAILDFLVV